MATTARRIEQVKNHLQHPPVKDPGTFEGIKKVARRAPEYEGKRVEGKVIIVTGCNSVLGIGRAAVHLYAMNAARAIYMCDIQGEHLETHKRELNSLYPQVDIHPRVMDAGNEQDVVAVINDALEKYGRLDVFFANGATGGPGKRFTDLTVEEFERTMRTNLTSVFIAAKHSAPAMQVTSEDKPYSGGSIIATASPAGLRSNGGSTDYSASKAAVINIMQTTCYQLAGTNVRCNALLPGVTETGMTASVFYERARRRGTEHKIGQLCPLKRGAVSDEIARVALFLASDEGGYVNGQAWAVDGGLSAGLPYILGSMQ